jgi:hypothetical protein
MAFADLLEQEAHVLGSRRIGILQQMERAVEQLRRLNQVQDAGRGPLELRAAWRARQ